MQAEARVMQIDGDHAIVELTGRRGGGCGRCQEAGGCGGSMVMGQMFGSRPGAFRLSNTIEARPGETVYLELGQGALLRVALMVYLLPVVLLLLGAFLGMYLRPAEGDLAAILGGGLGFGVALLAVGRFQRLRRRLIEPTLARGPAACSR